MLRFTLAMLKGKLLAKPFANCRPEGFCKGKKKFGDSERISEYRDNYILCSVQ
jgi:hypothetical protein